MHLLRQRRETLKLTMTEVGARSGCSRQMVAQIEEGQARPGVALAIRLGAAVGVLAVELFPELADDIRVVLAAAAVGGKASGE